MAVASPALARLRPSTWSRLVRALARPGRGRPARDELELRIERGLALAGHLVPTTCLGRGLTRYVFLRRAGIPVELAFGVGRVGDDYAGHCWIEERGEPYREPVDPRPAFGEILRIG